MNTLLSGTVNQINVNIKDIGPYSIPTGTLLGDLCEAIKDKISGEPVVGIINNRTRGFHYRLVESCDIELVDLYSPIGIRLLHRSSTFILLKACHDVLPDEKLVIRHTISNGVYCEFLNREIKSDDIKLINNRMQELIDADITIKRHDLTMEQATAIFKKQGQPEKIKLFEYRNKERVYLFELDGYYDYFYNHVCFRTGIVKKFRLIPYRAGMVLQTQDENGQIAPYIEQNKLYNVYEESKDWSTMLGTAHIAALNEITKKGDFNELIQVNEALHEKKIANIADQICNDPNIRLILISGPSSSGKTTFAQRLLVQLRVNGKRPVSISLDNYFIDREKTPLDENGEYDFEALEALNLDLFNHDLGKLIEGEEVKMPVYDFKTGRSKPNALTLKVPKGQPIIIEGIHALNPKLTRSIPENLKFKIFVSALTQLNLDYNNRVATTDCRLIRRIIRDNRTRGHSPIKTIARWPSVRRGEKRNIFPYQENADIFFNSSLVYEPAVLKPLVYPLLREITMHDRERIEAFRLIELLSFVRWVPIQDVHIPLNSILREFIGVSHFNV